MVFTELQKPKSIWHIIAFASIVLFFLFALVGCSSINPMTQEVYEEVMKYVKEEEKNEITSGINGFLFYISKDIQMVNFDREITPVGEQERLKEENTRDLVRLNSRTSGRLMSGSISRELNVCFEERGKKYPTLAFIQKKGPDGVIRFYFNWAEEEDTNVKYINYEGKRYRVDYEGDEEPYLLYKRTEKLKKTSRRMPGLRDLPYEYITPITP